MATFTWDHIHLRTANPEAMAEWFEKMLGAEVLRSMQQGKPRIDLKLGGAKIFIAPVAAERGGQRCAGDPLSRLDHFGLSVSGIDAIAADLKKKGVEFTREPTTVRPGTRICFIRAPEGVSIELLGSHVRPLRLRFTTTGVDIFTRLYRSTMSSLTRRMQPKATTLPMVFGALVP